MARGSSGNSVHKPYSPLWATVRACLLTYRRRIPDRPGLHVSPRPVTFAMFAQVPPPVKPGGTGEALSDVSDPCCRGRVAGEQGAPFAGVLRLAAGDAALASLTCCGTPSCGSIRAWLANSCAALTAESAAGLACPWRVERCARLACFSMAPAQVRSLGRTPASLRPNGLPRYAKSEWMDCRGAPSTETLQHQKAFRIVPRCCPGNWLPRPTIAVCPPACREQIRRNRRAGRHS